MRPRETMCADDGGKAANCSVAVTHEPAVHFFPYWSSCSFNAVPDVCHLMTSRRWCACNSEGAEGAAGAAIGQANGFLPVLAREPDPGNRARAPPAGLGRWRLLVTCESHIAKHLGRDPSHSPKKKHRQSRCATREDGSGYWWDFVREQTLLACFQNSRAHPD